jgi:exodeoxyribonuclease V alpha subunit
MRYRRSAPRNKSNERSVTIRGSIQVVFYAGPQFSAGRLISESGDEATFAGKFFARQGDSVILNGQWVTHPRYGRQLQVESLEYDLDLDSDGLARYLANHPEMKGIGPVKARLIAEAFGRDFDRVVAGEPERVAEAARIPLEAALQIRAVWLGTRVINKVATCLAVHGLTHYQIKSLVDKFGSNILSLLETDPYAVIGEVPNFGFKRIDKIAREVGVSKNDPARIRAGIIHSVNGALDQGHCWTEYEELIDQANLLLVMDDLDSRDRIDRELSGLIEKGALACASHGGRFLIARPEIEMMEEDLARMFRQEQGPNPHFSGEEDLAGWVEHTGPELNEKQREGVLNAMRHKLSVITGGAGVGKTYTVSAITDICEEGDLHVILAASTGKAAKRLEQLLNRPASTIHRLLGFDGKEYALGPENPIDADVIIADELGMVDIPLAWHLFRAIDLSRTAVVLVGDHNQLPPIGPGNLLRDLVRSQAVPMVVLDQIIRQAGVLKENCAAVLKGEVRKTSPPADAQPGPHPWSVADRFTDQGDAQRFLLEIFEHDLVGRLGFNLMTDVQLLTPTHKGPLGTHELNIELQRIVQKKIWGIDVPPPPPGRRPRFLLHDKVIQTRNNYETGVMNGTVGWVAEVRPKGGLTVNFDGELVKIEGEAFQDIQLAYCLTIHRVQGSEYPCVIVVVHKAHSFMHHRNLLYTAVTRARQTAILIGDRWGIQNCAKKQKQNERRTFLSFLLKGENRGADALR